jgi:glycolate dehydrogenase FAD-binding subunit
MLSPQPSALSPQSAQDVADVLSEGRPVRFAGGGTKAWGAPSTAEVEVSLARLDRVLEHNEGDLTAVMEAGVPLAAAQERFAGKGQMLALDPPLGDATVGGVFATGDSGPLRARYGAPRDLIVGIKIALADGNVVQAGGKVIKNVAGYDLAKLFSGSFGTLGAIVEVSVRLHPLPAHTATAVGASEDLPAVARAAAEAARSPLEHQGLDVRLEDGRGSVLVRFGGATPAPQADAARRLLADAGLEADVVQDDDDLWAAQRSGQRSEGGTVLRISRLPSELATVLESARRLDARLVGRAGLGLSWLQLESHGPDQVAAAVETIRRDHACVVLDAPAEVRERVDPWGPVDQAALALMRRVKERFDPAGICNPGVFAGGI